MSNKGVTVARHSRVRKNEDGRVTKYDAGSGAKRIPHDSVVPNLRSGAVTKVREDKPKEKKNGFGRDAMKAIGDGAVKGFVTTCALSMAFGTLGFSVGGAVAGSAMLSMVLPFAWPIVGLMVISSLADAGDRHLKKMFLTKKENKTDEQAREIVQSWEEMDKEDKKNKVETPYSLKHRVQDGAKAVWREASNWTYFVVGDLIGVPKAKLLGNINKQNKENYRKDQIIARIRFLEAKANSMVVPGYSNNKVDAIRARIRYEESKL